MTGSFGGEVAAGGARLTERGRATRTRIVEAASKLMLAQGVAATSIPDVLAAAGVSASQLYHYFADKQDLVHAVISHGAQYTLEVQGQLPLDSLEALRAWRDAVVAVQQERGAIRPDADPTRLALTVLAALQGGLLLTQVRRDTTPVEVALDAAIDHIATFATDIP